MRIGNIVYGSWDDQDEDGEDMIQYSLCKITGVDENGELGEGWNYMLENIDQSKTDYYGGLYGVVLSEEWLLKFGFTKVKSGYEEAETYDFYLGNIYFDMANQSTKIYSHYCLSFVPEFVHQLQNLVHAISGEELTIK